MDVSEDEDASSKSRSLIIPIINSSHFIEIFPDEIKDTPVATLQQVLTDEQAALSTWADAALLYCQHSLPRDSLALLEQATDNIPAFTDKAVQTRLLAAAGLCYCAIDKVLADQKFTRAAKVDTFFPMTWVGRGLLHLLAASTDTTASSGADTKFDQAKFFFDTTLKQCGPVVPALLGKAAVSYQKHDYRAAQDTYAQAMARSPTDAGARVGFGLACYQLGEIDRARAAFARALHMDARNAAAMVASAVLDANAERAMKRMSVANLVDHANAMAQNHLANHYFWKWTPVAGTVSVVVGSKTVRASQAVSLEPGERIRIGSTFESIVVEEDDDANRSMQQDDGRSFQMQDAWNEEAPGELKVWKKDYDRVIALAKGAYASTSVQAIQAESLFFLARVYHVREETDNALKFYERACKFAPDLAPARFGLAQTLVVKGDVKLAMQHLEKLLATSGSATDALALLGFLKVKHGGKLLEEGLGHLRKAVELDPFDAELLVMEALALQQHRSTYAKALERYKKAIDLMKRKGEKTPYDVFANSGVLCHETKKYDEAMEMYKAALHAIDASGERRVFSLENSGVAGGEIRQDDNSMFCDYVDSKLKVEAKTKEKTAGEDVEEVEEDSHTTVLKVVGSGEADFASLSVKEGDVVRVADLFVSSIVQIETTADSISITLKDGFKVFDGELALLVKRENSILDVPEAVTVAFNIARLHEVQGRILAAIELHKAILKRNATYVNSALRLACIAVDCGSLIQCADWLKISATIERTPEVLALIGNLHLSLCDWNSAQPVFEELLVKKIPSVESYATLSLGNIYFSALHGATTERYPKFLRFAADYYKNVLTKDPANAYAANGLGTLLGEKGILDEAKEVFIRVREVSGDSIADVLVNLGHIFLAQRKHPEALQMYQNFMKRAEDGITPVTSKSRNEDVVEVLLYIAFAFFDWARHTEASPNAAPADGRYKQSMEHLELAISKQTKKEIILKYNLALTKLHAANCILQKTLRNIPRTVEEVEEALAGLQQSLAVVEGIIEAKSNGEKVTISSSTLSTFVDNCKSNITSAETHLEAEKQLAWAAQNDREQRRLLALAKAKDEEISALEKKQADQQKQEALDKKAEENMKKANALNQNWQEEQDAQQVKKSKTKKGSGQPSAKILDLEEETEGRAGHGLFDDSDESDAEPGDKDDVGKDQAAKTAASRHQDLFGDSDDEEDEDVKKNDSLATKPSAKDLFGDSDDDSDEDRDGKAETAKDDDTMDHGTKKSAPSQQDLFGDSDDGSDEGRVENENETAKSDGQERTGESDEESDEELISQEATGKRKNEEDSSDDKLQKKQRVLEDDE
jgi:RNA polymerase-associated protein CTR9